MELQQQQLNELDDWLTGMEKKIEEFNQRIHQVETLENVRKLVAAPDCF